MRHKSLLFLYSAAHFWVDLSCAFLMFRLVSDSADFATCLLLYNFCAFAMQMPLGLLCDRFNRNAVVAALGCLLIAAAPLCAAPLSISIAAGLGNALFHLGGGLDTLNDSGKKAAALGIFVSPGALGLFIGTAWGRGVSAPLLFAPVGLLLFAAAILILARRTYGSFSSENAPYDPAPCGSALPLLPLFLVVVLRSWMGMSQSFPWKAEFTTVLTLALMLGKMAGGFLSDRLGRKRASLCSLLPCARLYLFSTLPLPGILAVFLFNMTMPITLHTAAEQLPGAKGFSFGLLTFALFLGFLPAALGWPSPFASPIGCAGAAALSAILLLWGLGRVGDTC